MTTKGKTNVQILATVVMTNPRISLALYGEFLDLVNDAKFLLWVENDLAGLDRGLNWSLENFEEDKDVDLTVKYLTRRLMDLYNGVPVVEVPALAKAEDKVAKKVEQPHEVVKKKKTSKGLLPTLLSLPSALFHKFMGLSTVGKIVVLIIIFAVFSQFGGPQNSPTEEAAQADVAGAEAPLNPFAAIDEATKATQTSSTVTSPIPNLPETFEQKKQKLINMQTTINYCSPIETGQTVGQATARNGSNIKDKEDAPINNGTSVTILDVVESNFYDFKGKAGCGSNLRVQVKTASGQVSWVHGSTVEGVAK